jgi:hypothetical protein
MNPLPDRKKLRRDYLRKRALAEAKGNGGILVFMIASVVATLSVIGALVFALASLFFDASECLTNAVMLAGIAVVSGPLAKWGWGLIHCIDDVKRLVYVPPIKPSTLPAEEILVRGAGEPTAPTETLLRATVKGEEPRAEELLRSTEQGG